MTFNKTLAAVGVSLAVSFALVGNVFAEDTKGTDMSPTYKGTVNVDVVDANTLGFQDRIQSELVEKPAPQIGQTRAAIEAIYGPSLAALAPNKDYELYTNEFDLTDGKLFRRHLTQGAIRVFEVGYNAGPNKSPNDKATDVKLRVIPRVGDHKNLVEKLLGQPVRCTYSQDGQHAIYGIPQERYVFFNDTLSSSNHAINAYFSAEGYMVGQEYMPSKYQGQYVMTSAGRYVEYDNNYQPDRKVGW